jgi:cytochrome c5
MGTLLRWRMVAPLAVLLIACSSHAAETSGASSASADPGGADMPVYDLEQGKIVFNGKCLRCHGEALDNAPRFGNAAEWEPRLTQPLATLIEHAIAGHGRMPPKGGFYALSNAEVSDAVAYVVDRSRKIILARENEQQKRDCHPLKAPDKCRPMDAEDVFTMQMLWLLGAPGR